MAEDEHGIEPGIDAWVVEANDQDVEIDVVAVHGPGGQRRETWTFDNDSTACWLPTAIGGRIMLYGYTTNDVFSPYATRRSIIQQATTFLEGLHNLRDAVEAARRPIVLVSHGLGGLLVKAAIVLATRNPSIYEWFTHAVRALLFFGYPHRVPNTACLRQQIYRDMIDIEKSLISQIDAVAVAEVLPEIITEINGMFIQSQILVQVHVVNLITSPDRASGALNFGITNSSATLAIPFESIVEVKNPYSTMTRLSSTEVEKLVSERYEWDAPIRGGAQEQALRTLSASASPIFPAPFTKIPDTISDLDKFVSADLDMFLHIQSSDMTVADLTDRICGYLRNAGVNVVCFQFDNHDARFGTVDTMLRTLIALICNQILGRKQETGIDILYYLHATQACSTRHLFDYLEVVIGYYCIVDKRNVYILGGLETCGNGATEFISHIARMMDRKDFYPRFLATSSGTSDFLSELTRIPEYVYANYSSERLTVRKGTENNFTLSPSVSTWRGSDNITPILSQITDAYHQDDDMLRILYQWLDWDHRPSSAVGRDLLELKAHSPEHIFEAILSNMTTEREEWGSTLLCWMSLSFRPLSVEEFGLVYSMVHSSNARPINAAEIVEKFSGLLQIEHGEVRFGHWRFRQWLCSNDSLGWLHLKSHVEGHAKIMRTCLLYLAGEHALPSVTDWPAHHHFPYAVEFWPRHYELIRGHDHLSLSVQPAITRLLADSACLNRWLEAYKFIADPFINFEAECSQALGVAAHFGFQELVECCQDIDNKGISLELIESAKRGHVQLVQRFLGRHKQPFPLNEPRLPRLLKVAASCDKQAVVHLILDHIPDKGFHSATEYPWMSDLLLQAVMVENEALVTRLLVLGADAHAAFDPPETFGGVIDLACMRNALGIIQIFIDRGIDISPGSGIGTSVICSKLGSWGNPETIKLLFENGIKPQMVNSVGRGFLYSATSSACHRNVDILLELAPLEDYCRNASKAYQPLLVGAANGSLKCVDAMIRHDADLSVADELGNALSRAVMNSHVRVVGRLLEEPAIDVNHSSDTAKAPIFRAMNARDPQKFVALLLKHGAKTEVQEPGDWKRTPLLYAAARTLPEFTRVVELLVQHNADKEAKDTDGWTPLYTACSLGSPETVKVLLKAGADLSATCGEGQLTALHAASQRPEVVSILLNAGVDPSKSSGAKFSPLELAAGGPLPLAATLMLKQPLEHKDSLPKALSAAVRGGVDEVVRQLLDMGVDVNHTTDDKISLLCFAVGSGNATIVRTLLEFRPDLHCKDDQNSVVGHWIRKLTSVEIVRLIANAGADLNAVNDLSHTPLIMAVIMGNWEVVRFLLSVKSVLSTLNFASKWGTALHNIFSLEGPNDIGIVQLLIDSGADVNIDCGGLIGTALSRWCTEAGDNAARDKEKMVRYLVEECHAKVHWSPPTAVSPLHVASRTCDALIIKLFIAKGADSEAADDIGRKPLHLACYNSLAAVEALLDGREPLAQHDFTARDLLGRIPLHYSVASGQLDLISHVLARTIQAGLSIDTRDNDGWTPLLWAARNEIVYGWKNDERSTNAVEVVKMLLEHNADPNARGRVPAYMDTGKWLAVDIAAYHHASELAGIIHQSDLPLERRGGPRKTGKKWRGICDACYLYVCGKYWHCQQCKDFDLCYKCHQSLEQIHPKHDFVEAGGEDEVSQSGDDQSEMILARSGSGLSQAPGHNSDIGDGQDLIDYDMGVVSDDSGEEAEDCPDEKDDENISDYS